MLRRIRRRMVVEFIKKVVAVVIVMVTSMVLLGRWKMIKSITPSGNQCCCGSVAMTIPPAVPPNTKCNITKNELVDDPLCFKNMIYLHPKKIVSMSALYNMKLQFTGEIRTRSTTSSDESIYYWSWVLG